MTAAHNIVLDMGNVLMTFDGMYFSRIFTDSEEDAQALYDGLYGRTEWALLDAGAIDHETMLRVAEAHTPERLLPKRARAAPQGRGLGRLRALERLDAHPRAA